MYDYAMCCDVFELFFVYVVREIVCQLLFMICGTAQTTMYSDNKICLERNIQCSCLYHVFNSDSP